MNGRRRITPTVTAVLATAAAAPAQQDELAGELFAAAIETIGIGIGIGIGGALNLLGVSQVVVGGGVKQRGQDLADEVEVATVPWLLTPHPDPRFVAAALGADAGVVGAAFLARQQRGAGE